MFHQSVVSCTSGMAVKIFLVSKMIDQCHGLMVLVFALAGVCGRS